MLRSRSHNYPKIWMHYIIKSRLANDLKVTQTALEWSFFSGLEMNVCTQTPILWHGCLRSGPRCSCAEPCALHGGSFSCPHYVQPKQQCVQRHWPLLCEANRWQVAFSGKLNIFAALPETLRGFLPIPQPLQLTWPWLKELEALSYRGRCQSCLGRTAAGGHWGKKACDAQHEWHLHTLDLSSHTQTWPLSCRVHHTHFIWVSYYVWALEHQMSAVGFRLKPTMVHIYSIQMHWQLSLSNLDSASLP